MHDILDCLMQAQADLLKDICRMYEQRMEVPISLSVHAEIACEYIRKLAREIERLEDE